MTVETGFSLPIDPDNTESTMGGGDDFSDQPMGYDEPVRFTADTNPEVARVVAEGIKRVYQVNRPNIRTIFQEYRNDPIAQEQLSLHLDAEVVAAVFGTD